MKNQITSASAGCSANNVSVSTDIVHNELEQFLNNMPLFHQEETNDENANPNVPLPVLKQANAALTANDIKDIFKSMMSDFKIKNRGGGRTTLPPSQGTDSNGNKTTYCWTHGTTTNLRHNSKSCSRPKEGHKEAAALQNKMDGSTELCRRRNTT